MKKNRSALFISLWVLLVLVSSCSKDNDPEPVAGEPVKIAFDSEVHEPGGDITTYEMVLKFNEPAPREGKIQIALAGKMTYGEEYYTEPAAHNGVLEVNMAKDQQSAKFKVHKLADLALGENILQMILKDPSTGFALGDPSISLLKFRKNMPSTTTIEFKTAESELWEDDSDGIQVQLQLNAELAAAEKVTIDFETSSHLVYGEDYTTEPALVLGQLYLDVPAGEMGVSFKVFPKDNNQVDTDYEINLAISSTTGHLTKGSQGSHVITLREDDNILGGVVHSIAELRDSFEQYTGDWYLPEDYYIEGVITSETNSADVRTVYIQDNSGGILLRFVTSSSLNYGDKVRLNLRNASGIELNGQKAMINVTDLSGTLLDEDVNVTPQEISLEQLAGGQFEGMRVRIAGVRFTQANGTLTFEGNRTISNGTFSAVVKTYARADFNTAILPEGTITIQGIVGDFGYLLPQKLANDITL